MSAHAWQQGGILTKDGRKDDIGEKPAEDNGKKNNIKRIRTYFIN